MFSCSSLLTWLVSCAAGPTGSGKTSLLNALAGRLPRGGNLEGEILVNGIPRGKGFRTISTYVMQVRGCRAGCLAGAGLSLHSGERGVGVQDRLHWHLVKRWDHPALLSLLHR